MQYRRLDDFKGPLPESAESDLLPVLLPCALCCAQQQLTASLVAHQIQQKNRQKILAPPQTETSQYSEFLSLCQHVECLVEKSMARMNASVCAPTSGKKDDETKTSIDDDMRLRSLRDSNRKPIMKPLQVQHQTSTTNNHYLWRNEQSSRDDKYKSRRNPMRNW